jgi:HK97 family phage major capsid protein
MDLKLLKNKRREKLDVVQALLDKAVEEERALTDGEREQYDKGKQMIDMLNEQIEEFEALDEVRSKMADPVIPIQTAEPQTTEPLKAKAGKLIEAAPVSTLNMYREFGELLQMVWRAGMPGGTIDPKLMEHRAMGLSEGVPSEGGFLVQKDFVAELLRRMYETGVLSSRVRRIPIGENSNGLKINANAETSRVTGSRWGGIRAYWATEAGVKTASEIAFRRMELELKKLIGVIYSTDELIQDATALGAVVTQAFSEEFAFMTDDAIYEGTGVGMPLGILNSGAVVTVAKEAGQPANTILAENIINMWSRAWGRGRPNSVWLINQNVEPQLYTMSVAVGVGGIPVYMPANGLSSSPYGALMGRPVIPIEYAATLGTAGDIMLADLSQYVMIDKGAIQSATSIHVKFLYDETAFRFVYRVDGQPAWNAPLTPFKGGAGSTQSPFVVLATRS